MSLTNFINSLDLCFIQEHWLLSDHLNDVCEISPDFLSIAIIYYYLVVVPLGGVQSFIVNHFHLTFHPCTLALIVFVVLGFVTPLACLTYLSVCTCLHIILLIHVIPI